MASEKPGQVAAETSPRSTILSGGSHMTTNVAVMNEKNVGSDVNNETKATTPAGNAKGHQADPASPEIKASPADDRKGGLKDSGDGRVSPNSQAASTGQTVAYPPYLTPQPGVGYYQGYPQSQVTPEPPSPAAPITATVAYDTASFFQQHGAFAPFGANTPLSPPRASGTMGIVPPASPLFPRVTSAGGLTGLDASSRGVGAPPSPNLPYMSTQLGSSMYQHYGVVTGAASQSSDSAEDASAWMDR